MLTGIDRIEYGVEDMETCARFLSDWGLREGPPAGAARVFRTLDGTEVAIAPADDSSLPPPIESGSTLRRVVWGVEDAEALERLGARLSDRAGFAAGGEEIACRDPNGVALGFRVSRRQPVAVAGSPVNSWDSHPRVDARTPVYARAEPVAVGHVVFFVPDIEPALAFYREALGFQLSDSYPGDGYFLRCRVEGRHHDLFLLRTPDARRGLNHVAYAVRDIHEVFGGGIHMNRRGWRTQIGPGRHPVSSAYFWYVHCPCGGLAEYYANDDYCTAAWQPKEWERSGENFAEWAIAGGIDPETRRQMPPG